MAAIIALSLGCSGVQPPPQPDATPVPDVTGAQAIIESPEIAMSEPDRFSWALFLYVNAPGGSVEVTNPMGAQETRDFTRWETWASDGETWPSPAIVGQPPTWPASVRNKVLQPSTQHTILGGQQSLTWVQRDGTKQSVEEIEEVRRNKEAFDYIVDQGLWNLDGLATALATAKGVALDTPGDPSAKAKAAASTIKFPVEAIEVKANWIPVGPDGVPEDEASAFYTNYAADKNGQVKRYALVAMHLISKRVPNWTWATFEHQNVMGRCDYLGCRDNFGVQPAYVAPKTPVNGAYPNGTVTPDLKALAKATGTDALFLNYRLKGSQTDFDVSNGVPDLLGNTITEQGFVQTSSCLGCHGHAGYTGGTADFPFTSIFVQGATPPAPDTNVSYNGPIEDDFFLKLSKPEGAPFSSQVQVTGTTALQLDFVWAFINAQPLQSAP